MCNKNCQELNTLNAQAVQKEMQVSRVSRGELMRKANDRQQWRSLVKTLRVQGSEEDQVSGC